MKTKKIILFLIVLFATLLWANQSEASIQSECIVVKSPKNGAEYKIGDTVRIDITVYDVYMNLFNNEIYTNPVLNIYYKGRDGLKTVYTEDYGCIWEKITDHQRGDCKMIGVDLDLKGEGGIMAVDVTCRPINTKTLAIDKRISQSSYAAKTVVFYIYSDQNASSSFESSYVRKNVGDANFTNKFNTNSDGKVSYYSNNTKVATVDSSTGEVKIKGEGTATITAKVSRSYIYKETVASYTVKVNDTGASSNSGNTGSTGSNGNAGNTSANTGTTENNTTPATPVQTEKETPTLKFENASIKKKTTDGTFTNKLTATTDGKVTYKSSNTKVASVNSSTGVVTIKGAGAATITATSSETSKYKKGMASYKVTVSGGTTSSSSSSSSSSSAKVAPMLKFASSSVSRKTTDNPFTNKLTATTDGKITYKSSNTSVATVNSSSGIVTIKGAGTATITATSSETDKYKKGTASFKVTVTAPASSSSSSNTATSSKMTPTLKFNYSSTSKTVGTAFYPQLNATTDGAITYSSSNSSVAGVNATSGKVVAKAPGTATITATSSETDKYKKGTASFTITVKEASSSSSSGSSSSSSGSGSGSSSSSTTTTSKTAPSLKFASSTVNKKTTDNTVSFTNKLTATTDGSITYKSSNTKVATVNATTGAVKVVGAGTATITATSKETSKYKAGTASYTVKVEKVAPTLKFANSSVSKKAKSVAFTNKLTATTDGTITYSSSDTSIATVDKSTGAVTPLKKGTVTITATSSETSKYAKGTASYTLYVSSENSMSVTVPSTPVKN